uniref:Tyrosine-protein kinase ephrin type A/B receptor-like domain-containing protein n=1 Tax=Hemiselmis tepida TaxID=464990 RepID=A0A7S0Z359_9CRYP
MGRAFQVSQDPDGGMYTGSSKCCSCFENAIREHDSNGVSKILIPSDAPANGTTGYYNTKLGCDVTSALAVSKDGTLVFRYAEKRDMLYAVSLSDGSVIDSIAWDSPTKDQKLDPRSTNAVWNILVFSKMSEAILGFGLSTTVTNRWVIASNYDQIVAWDMLSSSFSRINCDPLEHVEGGTVAVAATDHGDVLYLAYYRAPSPDPEFWRYDLLTQECSETFWSKRWQHHKVRSMVIDPEGIFLYVSRKDKTTGGRAKQERHTLTVVNLQSGSLQDMKLHGTATVGEGCPGEVDESDEWKNTGEKVLVDDILIMGFVEGSSALWLATQPKSMWIEDGNRPPCETGYPSQCSPYEWELFRLRAPRVSIVGNSIFRENLAENGGAMSFSELSNFAKVVVQDAVIESNRASMRGGGVQLDNTNGHVTITSSSLTSNQASVSGGALDASRFANLVFAYCSVSQNTALEGAAMYLHSKYDFEACTDVEEGGGSVEVMHTRVTKNLGSALQGGTGALTVKGKVLVAAVATDFEGNEGSFGGSITVTDDVRLSLESCSITHSKAYDCGGAAALSSSAPLVLKGTVRLNSNEAGNHGGAICAHTLDASTGLCSDAFNTHPFMLEYSQADIVEIARNEAKGGGGGGMYARCRGASGATLDVATASSVNLRLADNTAIYGGSIATSAQTFTLVSGQSASLSLHPGQVLPTKLNFLDAFGNRVLLTSGPLPYTVEASFRRPAPSGTGASTLISQSFAAFDVQGVCDFEKYPTAVRWPVEQLSSGERAFAPELEVSFGVFERDGPMSAIDTGWIPSPVVVPMHRLPCRAGQTFSTTSLICLTCHPGQYVLNPDQTDCVECPAGGSCDGDRFMSAPFSTFEVEGGSHYRVVACDPGYVLVRSSNPAFDQCVECPISTYSLSPARWSPNASLSVQAVENAIDAVGLCLDCPIGAFCPGGARVLPLPGFWREEVTRRVLLSEEAVVIHRRSTHESGVGEMVKLYQCSPGACLGNWTCANGHQGPLCSQCNADDKWVQSRTGCYQCEGDMSAFRLAILIIFSVLIFPPAWYFAAWHAYKSEVKPPSSQRLLDRVAAWFGIVKKTSSDEDFHVEEGDGDDSADSTASTDQIFRCCGIRVKKLKSVIWPLSGYRNIVISFYQILSSFLSNHSIKWGRPLAQTMQAAGLISRVDVFAIPAVSCLSGTLKYSQTLQLYTLVPIVLVAFCAIPSVIVKILGFTRHGGWSKHPKHAQVTLQLLTSAKTLLFIVYPTVSRQCFEGLRCFSFLGREVLISDPTHECPMSNPNSPLFAHIVISILLYPIGVPLLFLFLLLWYKVPQLVKNKRKKALVAILIQRYMVSMAVEMVPEEPEGREMSGHRSRSDAQIDVQNMIRQRRKTGSKEGVETLMFAQEDVDSLSVQQLCMLLVFFNVKPLKMERETLIEQLVSVGHRLEAMNKLVPEMEWQQVGMSDEARAVREIGSLFAIYKPDYWYFELVSIAHKLFLTSIIVFFFPSNEQFRFHLGITVVVAFQCFSLRCRPFKHPQLNNLLFSSLSVLFLVLMYGVVIFIHSMSPPPLTGSWDASEIEGVNDGKLVTPGLVLFNSIVFLLCVILPLIPGFNAVTAIITGKTFDFLTGKSVLGNSRFVDGGRGREAALRRVSMVESVLSDVPQSSHRSDVPRSLHPSHPSASFSCSPQSMKGKNSLQLCSSAVRRHSYSTAPTAPCVRPSSQEWARLSPSVGTASPTKMKVGIPISSKAQARPEIPTSRRMGGESQDGMASETLGPNLSQQAAMHPPPIPASPAMLEPRSTVTLLPPPDDCAAFPPLIPFEMDDTARDAWGGDDREVPPTQLPYPIIVEGSEEGLDEGSFRGVGANDAVEAGVDLDYVDIGRI